MFGDIALKISSEFQQEGNLAITPLSFKVHQEKAYTDYMAKKETNLRQCKLGIVSSFPPTRCGIGQFADDLYGAMKNTLPENCDLSVIALHDSSSGGPLASLFRSYDAEKVSIIIDLDQLAPSPSILRAANSINDAGFTHLLLQSEFGLTPVMWQQADLLRWISPEISVVTVFHTPRAYPNEEERAFIRQLSRLSQSVVSMSHYACHSLKNAFGVPASKVMMIPHGVKDIYADMGDALTSGSVTKDNPEKFILLSDGLIHEHKGYLRVIRALPQLIKLIPNLVFRIVGKQHPKSASRGLMDLYINEARTLGVRKHLEWVDTFFTPEELLDYYAECDVYVSLYDEITPISGTLTAAMAAGLAIVATPYRYAIELLSEDRGILLSSFDVNGNHGNEFVQSIVKLYNDFDFRKGYGKRAAMGVSSWRWPRIASAYWNLLLKNDSHITATGVPPIVHSDPFFDSLENTAHWRQSMIVDFNGNHISFSEEEDQQTPVETPSGFTFSMQQPDNTMMEHVVEPLNAAQSLFCPVAVGQKKNANLLDCLYVIYADSEIQVNGAIFQDGTIRAIGIRTPEIYILVQEGLPLDVEETPNTSKKNFRIQYQNQPSGFTLITNSTTVRVNNPENGTGISIEFESISRFSSPKGILGSTLQYKFDEFKKQSMVSQPAVVWSEWRLNDENLFSIQSTGQSWTMFSIEANTYYIPVLHDLPENSFSYRHEWISMAESRLTPVRLTRNVFPLLSENNFLPIITLQFEGPFFDFSGFATVNRALFMQLSWRSFNFMVRIAPTDPKVGISSSSKPPLLDSVVKYLMWANIAASRPSSSMILGMIRNFGNSPGGGAGGDRNAIGSVSRSTTAASFAQVDSIFQPRKSPPSLATSEPLLAGLLLRIFPLLAPSFGKESNRGVGSSDSFPDIVFRNAWLGGGGPDLSLPVSPSTFWIQSQPWEFWGVPESWLPKLSLVDVLVVPSEFSKDTYIANGVDPSKIVILPHGVTFSKIQQIPKLPAGKPVNGGGGARSIIENIKNLSGCSKFIAIFSGGLLARKGVDVAVKSFLASFKRADEACLVLHSVYGDGYYFDQIRSHQADYEAAGRDTSLLQTDSSRYDIPRLIYLDSALEWSEMIQLFKLGDIFLAPYRAEGFGLIILEAMAAGTAVAVTQAGPALEFTTSDSVFYISQEERPSEDNEEERKGDDDDGAWKDYQYHLKSKPVAICKISPCGPGYKEFNGSKTKVAPRWAAPSVESLKKILKIAYHNPDLVKEKAINAHRLAEHHTWTRPGQDFEMLLKILATETRDNEEFPIPVRIREALLRLKSNKENFSETAAKEEDIDFPFNSSEVSQESSSNSLSGIPYSINEKFSLSNVFMSAMNLPSTLGIRLLRCIF
ncbi:hypothetical protein MDAP_001299 [Mitosporidium daphniae]